MCLVPRLWESAGESAPAEPANAETEDRASAWTKPSALAEAAKDGAPSAPSQAPHSHRLPPVCMPPVTVRRPTRKLYLRHDFWPEPDAIVHLFSDQRLH